MQRRLPGSRTLLLLLAVWGLRPGSAQIVLNSNLSPQLAVQNVLLGAGVTATNVTFNGQAGNLFTSQLGGFNGANCNLGLTAGVILSSGGINNAFGPNNSGGSSQPCVGVPCGGSDPDLVEAANNTTGINDVAVLEFDFIPTGDSIRFDFVFASDEYLEFVNSSFNDIFGFFLSGPNISGPYSNNAINIALVPGSLVPVTIDNVNDVVNAQYYVVNGNGTNAPYNVDPSYVQYDGLTTALTAKAAVTCGEVHHIKICVGDAGDTAFDSAVFLAAGSFQSNIVELSSEIDFGGQDSTIYEGCGQATVILSRQYTSTLETVGFVAQGTATNAVDYSAVPGSFTFQPGQDSISVVFSATLDNDSEGPELVELIAITTGPCGSDSTFLHFYINDAPPIQFQMGPGAVLTCPGDSSFIGITVGGGFGDLSIDWNTGVPDDAPGAWVTPVQTTEYLVTVTDECGVFTHSGSASVVVPVPAPLQAVALPDTLSHCPEPPVMLHASVQGGTLPYQYEWSDGLGNAPQAPVAPALTQQWTLTVRDVCGEEVLDQVTVAIVYDSIQVVASADTTICYLDTAQLSAVPSLGTGAYELNWSDGGIGPDHDVSPPWSMDFEVTTTDACAISATDVVHVQVHRPSADFSHHTDEYTVDFPIQFIDHSQGGTEWLWEFGYNDETSTELHPVFAYPEPGIYTVILTITDELGCIDSTFQHLFIDPTASFYLPTSFTPNGDGINETYGASGMGVLTFEMRIFDRWGELIFNTNEISQHWDGTRNGGSVPDGVYVVWVRYRDVLNVKREHYGQVTLVR